MTRISLEDYLIGLDQKAGSVPASLRQLIMSTASACNSIARQVSRGALANVLGTAGTENVQGEIQKKLDVIANDMLIEVAAQSGQVAGIASEEMDEILQLPAGAPRGDYLLLFDPLDGSSNIDVNVSIGTIFSVLRAASPEAVTEADFLQPGRQQVAAGYAVYGPQNVLVLTVGHGVDAFTLDSDSGTWVLTQSGMRIPEETSEFAINMSNQRHWAMPVQRYVSELLAGRTGTRGKDYNMRWVASMVADVHRILTRGGIFIYPWDRREPEKAGKLRLMYEANPMSFLVEQAGGAATNGRERMLDVQPGKLHERVPVFLGSKSEVQRVTQYHA